MLPSMIQIELYGFVGRLVHSTRAVVYRGIMGPTTYGSAQILLKFPSPAETSWVPLLPFLCLVPIPFWGAVKELKLSYHIGETLSFTIYTQYGNLI